MIQKVDANCTSHLAELLLYLRRSTFRKKTLHSLGQFHRQLVTWIMYRKGRWLFALCNTGQMKIVLCAPGKWEKDFFKNQRQIRYSKICRQGKKYFKNLSGQSFKGQSIKEPACFDHYVFIRAPNNPGFLTQSNEPSPFF